MIRVSVLYAPKAGGHFDFKYYSTTHAELVRSKLAPHGLVAFQVDKGVGSAEPGAPAPFVAVGQLTFKTLAGFQEGFGKNAPELLGDMPNYTDLPFQVQVSEILP